jgi:mono/diheme cytochrome c family protein
VILRIALSEFWAYNSSQNSNRQKDARSLTSAEEAVMLKSLLPFFAVVLVAIIALPMLGLGGPQNTPAPALAPAPAETPTPPVPAKNPVKPTAESQAKAKALYQIDCSMCHGDNGNGKTDLASSMSLSLDNWTDSKTLSDKTDGDLFNIIRNGKDKMPPESEGRAKDAEVWNLVIYIRSFSKPSAAASTAAPAH